MCRLRTFARQESEYVAHEFAYRERERKTLMLDAAVVALQLLLGIFMLCGLALSLFACFLERKHSAPGERAQPRALATHATPSARPLVLQ
jgi:hypothetical protein